MVARKRKPAVTQYERLRWVEELEKGKGITQIAKDAKRDIRVVKNHIKIALQEREAAQARRDFLVTRLEQHQQDLLNDIKRINSIIQQFPPRNFGPADPLEKKVHDGLIKHFEDVSLKDLREKLQTYLILVDEYENMRSKCEKELKEKESELLSALPQGLDLYHWTPRIIENYVKKSM